MARSTRHPREVRERAVALVVENQSDYALSPPLVARQTYWGQSGYVGALVPTCAATKHITGSAGAGSGITGIGRRQFVAKSVAQRST